MELIIPVYERSKDFIKMNEEKKTVDSTTVKIEIRVELPVEMADWLLEKSNGDLEKIFIYMISQSMLDC